MKDRIQKLINHEQLTSAKFADLIGVQRSSISHILSGRNKPSLEFVQKVLATFTSLNTDWLIFGKGKMYTNSESVGLFPGLLDNIEIQEPKPIENQRNEIPAEPIQTPLIDEPTKELPVFETIKAINSNDKKIERIVIFYSDRTFDEYRPS